MIEMKSVYYGCVLVLAAAPAAEADMSDPQPVVVDSGWKFQVTFDGWLAGLDGDIGVRGLPAAGVDVSPLDVLGDLDGAFAGSYQAVGDSWLLYADVMWAKISTGATVGPFDGTVNFEQTQIVATALVGYKLPVDVANMQVHATGGLRYQHNKVEVGIDPAFFPSVDRSGSQSWADPVVGLALHYDVNSKWFVDVMADVGGFGVASDVTLQGAATLGYNWTDTVASSFGYKALYTDYEEDGFRYDAVQHGFFTRLAVKF
jgi:hypothetical protein